MLFKKEKAESIFVILYLSNMRLISFVIILYFLGTIYSLMSIYGQM